MDKATITFELPEQLKADLEAKCGEISTRTMIHHSTTRALINMIKDWVGTSKTKVKASK